MAADGEEPAPAPGLKQRLCYYVTLALAPFTVGYLKSLFEISESRREEAERRGLSVAEWSDFTLMLVSALTIMTVRGLSVRLVKPVGDRMINPKYKGSDREARIDKFATCFFKCGYFLFATYYGAKVLLHQPWWPKELFGSGDANLCWEDYPFSFIPDSIKTYYMVSMGYHFHSLIYHVYFTPRRNSFEEMTLHHVVTLLLYTTSFMDNQARVGSLIVFLHDVPDVFVYAVRTFVDSKHVYPTLCTYLSLLGSWAYFRLYVLGFVVIPATFVNRAFTHYYYFIFGMLIVLLCLHVYWFHIFLLIGRKFQSSGEAVDAVEQVSANDVVDSPGTKGKGKKLA